MVLACENNKGMVKVTVNEDAAEVIYEQPGERWHYINGAYRSVCEPCNLIGNSLGLRARAKNVVTVTNEKIAFGTDMGWIIDRETGAMNPTNMGLSSFVCRLATKAF